MNIGRPRGVDRPRFADALATAAAALQLPLSPQQSQRLLDYVDLLRRWNATYNLTAIREPSTMLTHHVIDCLAAVVPLRREIAARRAKRLLDVGSGGGLPGVVFAVMEPEAEVTCVESVGKKAAFLTQAGTSLALGNLHVAHVRVEKMVAGPAFDIVVSRAFASLSDFTEATSGALADSGVWMAMKGKRPEDEIEALPPDIEMFHVEPLTVPGLGAARCLVWMRQRESKHQHFVQEKRAV